MRTTRKMRVYGWRRRAARRAATAAGLATGGLMASGVGIGYAIAHTLTRPRRQQTTDVYTITPFETGADYEPVSFRSAGGEYDLHGWWFLRPETKRVIVGCHGYRSNKSEMIGIATALWRAGFCVLLFDYHGHGDSYGTPVTLGYSELQDFFAALNYAERRVPGARLGVMGYSMGASIAIMGSARRPEVRAVMADSPFATHAGVVNHNVARLIGVSGGPLHMVTDFFLDRMAGYRSDDVAPVRDVVGIAPRPLLLFHGTADETVPVANAHAIYAAAGEPKELVLGQGAVHCGTYFLDRPAYCQRVIQFFTAALDADGAPAGEPAVALDRALHRKAQA